jgi:hypothetical protein
MMLEGRFLLQTGKIKNEALDVFSLKEAHVVQQ